MSPEEAIAVDAADIAMDFMNKVDRYHENGMSRTGLLADLVIFIATTFAKTKALEKRIIELEERLFP
jgi:uncharacterized protein YktA (UPF0223 family)